MLRSAPRVLLLFVAPVLVLLGQPAGWAQQRPPEAGNAPGQSTRWRDTLTTRLEALALLQTLNADLLSHDSATLTLDRWCETHQMASAPKVVAERLPDVDKPPTDQQRGELAVTASEPVRYRRVRLHCGDHVLSVAENWYVPGRLTPDMNHQLETTDVAFGRAAQPLHFTRHTLEATLLWSPLPSGWDREPKSLPARSIAWPGDGADVLRHRAILVLPDGRPISEVVETYTMAVLAFPEPRPER
jgi:chorismate-pyruvate lyase